MSRTTQGRGTRRDADDAQSRDAQTEDVQTENAQPRDAQSPAAQRPSPEYASRDQLRAMAHPLRLDIMERVGRRGTARAADLAADLGIPANSVSYHLRILARGGVIEEAPEAARDRRDRVWRLAQDSFMSGREDSAADKDPQAADPEYVAASKATSLAIFEWMRTAWAAELSRTGDDATSPEDGLGQLQAATLRLTLEEMKELNRVVAEMLHEAKERHRDDAGVDLPDSEEGEAPRTFRVLWAAVGEQEPGRRGTGA